jgi:hypothetical protein
MWKHIPALPANKLRVCSLRWPPQEATKKAQGEKKLKTKNKSGWGLPKMSPNCRQNSFSVYFEISNVKSSLLHKKKSKSPKQNILIGCGVCVPGRQS